MRLLVLFCLLLTACPSPTPKPKPKDAAQPLDAPAAVGTVVSVTNESGAPTTVYVSFGADSVIKAADWPFCTGSGLVCSFPLIDVQELPNPTGAYLNMTLAFGSPVGCNATKAEINVNNPIWYDTLDVSLVDGYSNQIEISYTPPGGPLVALGPNAAGSDGDNSKVLGVYPYGCDICTARQNPPCDIAPGGTGCKAGTQYKPDVPCQYQGAVKGGGGTVNVVLRPST